MPPFPLRLLNPYIVLVNFPDPAAKSSFAERLVPPVPAGSFTAGVFIQHNLSQQPPSPLQLRCRNTAVTNISGSAAFRQTVRKTFLRVNGLSVAWHFKLLRHETQLFFFWVVLCLVLN